ncbi:MAG: alpha-amylase [Chloroflexi bacterium]|nr:alpha amylase C-terminal domain-containing protein [Ardenticatenaceae bacterium]MBL1128364.1 alpha-amylase [Chloroflexota bacterium]NOG34440.1 alpha-amylase [Chloroflexota bacterium]GIK57672.1 MAG: putative cyclomaltodextrin glucanotransferase [Chloroflexota bacterium]
MKTRTRILLLFILLAALLAPMALSAPRTEAGPVTSDASYKSDVCYQIITDRFYDGNSGNNNPAQSPGLYDASKANWKLYWGGDWAGIQAKMSYLKDMGVTAIWISPPVDNINVAAVYGGVPNAGYHGYWARDFKTPEEHFGTWTDFQNLVNAAHANGIKVVVDWAPNHTSPADVNNPSFAEDGALYNAGTYVARYSNDPNGYFHHNGGITNWDDRYEAQYLNLADLADFEQTNSFVNQYMQDALALWLAKDIDGLRIDAVKHMTSGWQRAYNDDILHDKDLYIFGEWYLGSTSDPLYRDNVRFSDDSGTAVLDFYLNHAIRSTFGYGQPMSTLDSAISQTNADYKYKENLVTFIDNHDMSRFLSINNNNTQLHLALAFLLTVRGTPCIYYGTEQYLFNNTNGGGDPYNRPMMNSWNQSTTAYQVINKLSTLKQTQPALQFGNHQQRWINNDVYIYERKFYDDVVLVAINKNPNTWYEITGLNTALPAGTYSDQLNGLVGGHNITVNSGSGGNNPIGTWWLGPGRAMVWSYNAADPGTPQLGAVSPTLTRAGHKVTLEGQGFGAPNANNKVYFVNGGNQYQASIVSWTTNRIVATVPSGVPAGLRQVKVVRGASSSNLYDVQVLTNQQVPVTFQVNNATTNWGDQVYLTGNVYELSNWATTTVTGTNLPKFGGPVGPAVTASGFYPSWKVTASVPCGTAVQFKFLKISGSGGVTWEGGSNHSYTTPACGSPAPGLVTVNWQN